MSAATERDAAEAAETKRCAGCGVAFHCGRDDARPCWCADLPRLPPTLYVAGAGCFCPACLEARLQAAGARPVRQDPDALAAKEARRLAASATMAVPHGPAAHEPDPDSADPLRSASARPPAA